MVETLAILVGWLRTCELAIGQKCGGEPSCRAVQREPVIFAGINGPSCFKVILGHCGPGSGESGFVLTSKGGRDQRFFFFFRPFPFFLIPFYASFPSSFSI